MAARSNRARSVSPLSVSEAVDALQDAVALEEFSPLTGSGVLVVDLGGDANVGPLPATLVGRAAVRLAELPCPTIGIRRGREAAGSEPHAPAGVASTGERVGSESRTSGGSAGSPRIDAHLDVIVTTDVELERVLGAVQAHPIAATALVQLLRHGENLDVHEALIAESLVYSTLQAGPEFSAWLKGHKAPSAGRDDASEPAVLVVRNGARLELTLNRPQRHNAYSSAMRDALVAGLQVAAADDAIREIVLGGNGPSFSAGGDLSEFGTLPDPATAHVVRSTRNAARLLARLADRVRAKVHGACVGAGVELPAFAKRVVARPDAFFELPEVSMGLVPGAGGTASIPRRIGRQRTAYLALTGERIDAHTAHAWGLVDEIVA